MTTESRNENPKTLAREVGLKLQPGPGHGYVDQPFDLEHPFVHVDLRWAERVQHRPLARARLARRNAVFAKRVRADDDVVRQSQGNWRFTGLQL